MQTILNRSVLIWRVFRANNRICAPYMSPAQLSRIEADFASMTTRDDYLRRIPKAELHIHIEGTLEPEMMFELATRNGIPLPYPDAESVRAAYVFSNLQSFLDIYYQACAVLVTERVVELGALPPRRRYLPFRPKTRIFIEFATIVGRPRPGAAPAAGGLNCAVGM